MVVTAVALMVYQSMAVMLDSHHMAVQAEAVQAEAVRLVDVVQVEAEAEAVLGVTVVAVAVAQAAQE
jgi:hypothetical protein